MGKHHGTRGKHQEGGLEVLNPKSGKILNPHLPEIVNQYLSGTSLQDIALQNSVNVRTIYRWLLTECGEEYQEIVTQALANRIAEADVMLMNSTDSCQVSRAREIARFARMDFERRRPKLYGQKQELEIDKTVHVHVHRDQTPQPVDPAGRVVDVTPKAVESKGSSTP
jgi:transposase-like protein